MIVLGIGGASGALYAKRLLLALGGAGEEVALIVSRNGERILRHELGCGPEDLPNVSRRYDDADLGAAVASGSNVFRAMVVAPCSVSTCGKLASGIADTLITRTATVALKERRPLVLVVRETPLTAIHLEGLARLASAGAVILPAMPAFYSRPRTVDEAVDTVVARVLDHLGTAHRLDTAWRGDTRGP